MKLTAEIKENRAAFLHSLRTGNHKKGAMKSDERGHPIFKTEVEREGACACGIMCQMFGMARNKSGQEFMSPKKAQEALGLTYHDCYFIQTQISDTPLTFPEIADRIEAEVFNKN
ncbi:hypothetical protein LJY25_14670 [Hymenobacter sp. BT175]|uniref:hypothetical protein n=1 Tax=Hymenobacter translucens TaxID=2886507 RepID=UPI001D0F1A78|nr:hypothetical protein [Hymenobacter translucens]MCC2547696.1 hypothetical protein [Hymenobacter translucens]